MRPNHARRCRFGRRPDSGGHKYRLVAEAGSKASVTVSPVFDRAVCD
jgi:hypothetical protein